VLNENAAVVTPHFSLGKKIRQAHLELFGKVEAGRPLTVEESAEYRVLYQTILRENQSRLALFDGQLTVLSDLRMGAPNNVGSRGIQGSHDHHDASANANFAELQRYLARLEQADGITGSPSRVLSAIGAYKDLTDIILHMATAPQTKSVDHLPREPADELQAHYESMMVHFKRAQFEPVNSPLYVTEVHLALGSYDALVARVQSRIFARLGPLERSLSGRWGSWHSFGPSLKGLSAARIPRKFEVSATPAAPVTTR
jgi:hypothetical protein